MRELTLQEIKDVEVALLKRFHAFCTENNIRYFISHGTLLGAIRYKAFIPWDDDLDVLVPREDYDRLLSLYQDSERYRIFAPEKDPRYLFPYAKFCDMTTRKIETGYDNGVELGVDIDIFPLDYWDDDLEKAKQEVKRQRRSRVNLAWAKLVDPGSGNLLKRIAKRFFMTCHKLRGGAYYVEQIRKEANKPEQKGSRYMGGKSWCVYGERDIMPAEIFAEAVELEFEGQMFPAPVGYDAFLTSLYGDYLPEPPPEKRKTHHTFRAYSV